MDIFDNDLSIPVNLIRQWCFLSEDSLLSRTSCD